MFQSKQYRKWSYLSKITAILFRESEDEQYNEDIIEMRAKAFENLNVSEAYKGYFFLHEHINKLQKSMLTSLMERKAKAQEQKASLLSRVFTGKIKPIRLLNALCCPFLELSSLAPSVAIFRFFVYLGPI